jgi:hypothetical protein
MITDALGITPERQIYDIYTITFLSSQAPALVSHPLTVVVSSHHGRYPGYECNHASGLGQGSLKVPLSKDNAEINGSRRGDILVRCWSDGFLLPGWYSHGA